MGTWYPALRETELFGLKLYAVGQFHYYGRDGSMRSGGFSGENEGPLDTWPGLPTHYQREREAAARRAAEVKRAQAMIDACQKGLGAAVSALEGLQDCRLWDGETLALFSEIVAGQTARVNELTELLRTKQPALPSR